ncbi:hypothetical protein LEP1GSC161_0784 [Leptospira santarosai str. CBC1416]|uniref:Uncharacterized protein n=2 Tax=Leptospira santarosai TaxID=28183 RepID=K8YDM2_9LEPT|nr:hypothetical protein LSS_06979 [Leptospira santarosai serovar Shermani str. LT 821]EMM75999.1 hypothetical protein LEP1GSC040_3867 [Leptospira santarosai str. 2000030832]EMO15533.1 hypothetical protein LEP1GSC165_0662 [Leptospira santarosai str. CBC523]EMO58095.1 hypothetical protein LEP1GSC161_0784 [Leptospira santarosai str. CBC1416]
MQKTNGSNLRTKPTNRNTFPLFKMKTENKNIDTTVESDLIGPRRRILKTLVLGVPTF